MLLVRLWNACRRRLIRACYKPFFKELGKKSYFVSPLILTPGCIVCKERVYVAKHARMEGIVQYNERRFTPSIVLEEGVTIQQNLHLTCAEKITVGRNTAVGANVTITDIHHPYEEISIPIEHQDIRVAPVSIGEDCKIYNNAVILPGVSVGNHVTIGANSVVAADIPDYSVAVGAPARVVKQYDFGTGRWEKR